MYSRCFLSKETRPWFPRETGSTVLRLTRSLLAIPPSPELINPIEIRCSLQNCDETFLSITCIYIVNIFKHFGGTALERDAPQAWKNRYTEGIALNVFFLFSSSCFRSCSAPFLKPFCFAAKEREGHIFIYIRPARDSSRLLPFSASRTIITHNIIGMP